MITKDSRLHREDSQLSPVIFACLLPFSSTLFFILALHRYAEGLGLIDLPDNRKQHQGAVAVVGGIAIFGSLLVGICIWTLQVNDAFYGENHPAFLAVALGAFLLVFTGAVDDALNLSISLRIMSEVLVALLVMELMNLRLVHLGDLFGTGHIRLSTPVSLAFTVIAIFGLINAFNMLDGADGLLGLLVIATILNFHLVAGPVYLTATLYITSSVFAFLISNLSFTNFIPKTFLGDAGSKLLGFLIVFLLLNAASGQVGGEKIFPPVTALFLVAVPLYDMAFTAMRRLAKGKAPFTADRSHIHHLLMLSGVSSKNLLFGVTGLHISFGLLGLALHNFAVPEHQQFALFVVLFLTYCSATGYCWTKVSNQNIGPLSLD